MEDRPRSAGTAATRRPRRPGARRGVAGLVAALAACVFAACDSGGGGGGGGSPTEPAPAIAVTATPTSIGVGGAATVRVQATLPGGGPGAGQSVELATTVGRLDATVLVTDAQGRAETVLRGTGGTGVAQVRAQLRGTGASATAEVRIGLDRTVRIEATPAEIGGAQRATVLVTVFEPGGGTAPAGVGVTLATTLGSLAATQLTTDATGTARTTLGTSGQTGTARVTATVAGAAAASADVVLRTAYALTVTASPTSIAATGSATITVLVAALDPSARVDGLVVDLATTRGRLGSTRVVTDRRGVASTTLRGDGSSGAATVTATVAGANTAVAVVQVAGGLLVQVAVSPERIPAGGAAAVDVLVRNGDGSPAPAGTEVRLTATLGRLDADRLSTGAGGRASTVLRGDGRTGTGTVRATVPGSTAQASQVVTFF